MQSSAVAVITGGSSGIGAEVARLLTAGGWRCVLVARGEERLRALADELGAEAEVCDVADRAAVDALAERIVARHPRIKLLVNNAGIPGRANFVDGDPDRIENVMRVNYFGGIWCLRAFLPALEAAVPADVVNVVSVAGTVALPHRGPTRPRSTRSSPSPGPSPRNCGREGSASTRCCPASHRRRASPSRACCRRRLRGL